MSFHQWKDYSFKYPFYQCENINEIWSQACQDIFVLSVLNGKTNGSYLEIGAGPHDYTNNTYLLSKNFSWNGTSIEINSGYLDSWATYRPNSKLLLTDALSIDFQSLIVNNYTSNCIDYLQIDIDPSINSLQALKKIPFDTCQFRVITFETDHYIDGSSVRNESREILRNAGYELIVGDVLESGINPFEDWYANLNLVNTKVALAIKDQALSNQNPFSLLFV